MEWYHFSRKPIETVESAFLNPEKYPVRSSFKPRGIWLSDEQDKDICWSTYAKQMEIYDGEVYTYRVKLNEASRLLYLDTTERVMWFHKHFSEYNSLCEERISLIKDDVYKRHWKGIVYSPYFPELGRDYFWYRVLDIPSACIWDASCIESFEFDEIIDF